MTSIDYKYDGIRTWHEQEDGSWAPVVAWRRRNGKLEYEYSGLRVPGSEYFKLKLQGRIR